MLSKSEAGSFEPGRFDSELALPDDLAELASQLSADAERLSACYPAGKPNRVVVHAASTKNRLAFAASLVVGLAVSVIGGVVITRSWLPEPAIERGSVANIPTVSDASSIAVVKLNRENDTPLIDSESSTISLAELSSPEIEALLDLWEREPNEAPSVAF